MALRKNTIIQTAAAEMMSAIQSGDKTKCNEALKNYGQAIADTVKDSILVKDNDTMAYQQRGRRILTTQEIKYYDTIAKAGKSDNPKQYFATLADPNDKIMPTTVIEDVFKTLVEEHPLLQRINFQSVEYLTRWILNDHTKQTAVWGDINESVAKEITSAFRVIDIAQSKLSAFALIDKSMLDLGPVYLDAYIRTFMTEALAVALEKGIVSGSGKKQPIGLDRDIHRGVAVSDGTYPQKTAVAVTSFAPVEYGTLLANLAETEVYYTNDSDGSIVAKATAANTDGSAKSGYTKHGGRIRTFSSVTLICNQVDYLKKVMPATTVQRTDALYQNNVFPFPTEVIISNEIETGKALVCLPEEYFAGVGTSKDGVIEYSDEVKFLEDMRAFKIKLTANGTPYDNTVAVLVDISNLDPAYITVVSKQAVAEA